VADTQVTGDLVVLTFQWRDASGLIGSETFGPWEADRDGMYTASVRDFIAGWARLTGLRADVVTIAAVLDPAGWVREREDEGLNGKSGADGGEDRGL